MNWLPEIKIKIKKVKVSMSAFDWHLFSDLRGAEAVARKLNRKFENCVEQDMSPADICIEMRSLMMQKENRELGAGDTEPNRTLNKLINVIHKDWY